MSLDVWGDTHDTMATTTGRDEETLSQSFKGSPSSDRGLKLDLLKLESLVIAGQPHCGEYVLEPCTHRPSSQGSRECPKPVLVMGYGKLGNKG